MPEAYLSKFYQKPKKSKSPEKSAKKPAAKESDPLPKAEGEDAFEIFGPK